MTNQKSDLLQGTLDLLILKALTHGALHGWAISKRIQQMSKEAFTVTQGSLYPALYRLEDRGWIVGEEQQSAEQRRIRVYRLTSAGGPVPFCGACAGLAPPTSQGVGQTL